MMRISALLLMGLLACDNNAATNPDQSVPGEDLAGVDFAGVDFSGVDFAKPDLAGADLKAGPIDMAGPLDLRSPCDGLFCPTDMDIVSGTCTGPSDCTAGGMPICCIHFMSGNLPTCTKSANLQCQATCDTALPQTTCNSMGTGAACAQKSDCTNASFPNCCALPQFFTAGHICVSDADAVGETCTN
jgi:uncharacterized protein YjbI with pentapeptide repeats